MQSMSPDIAPEPIEPDLPTRRSRPRDFKHAVRDVQPRIRRHYLDGGHGLGELAPLARSDGAVCLMCCEQFSRFVAGYVGQRDCSGEVGVERAVSLQDIKLLGGAVLVVATVRPSTGRGRGVLSRELQGSERDADVEIGEDELDGR